MRLTRRTRISAYTATLLIALAALYVAKNWVMLARHFSHPGDLLETPVQWYRPTEIVPGSTGSPFPAARGRDLTISYDALKSAMDYAKSQGSHALIVARHGRIELEKYWFDTDRSTKVNSGSMASTLLALLVGAAVADGYIQSVDDPLSRYLPELAGDERRDIRLRDALEMTSGLDALAPSSSLLSKFVRHYMGTDFQYRLLELDAGLPGAFQYNTSNVDLLGIVLERAVGRRYADYLSTQIWIPIGAQEANMYLDREGGFVLPSCCVFATAMDWLKVGQLILNKGRTEGVQVISEEWIDRMLEPSTQFPAFGRLIWRGVGSPESEETAGSNSSSCGHNKEAFVNEDLVYLCGEGYQRVYIVPSLYLVIVRIGGSQGGWPPDWEESRLPNIIAEGTDVP